MAYEKGALILADRLVYQVEDELGSGGMAHVYLVREKALNKVFVVKVLDTEIARQHPSAVTAFGQEARALAQMESEHLPSVSQLGQTTDEQRAHFYTMERIAGHSLRHLVQFHREKHGTSALRLDQALNITSQIAQGLAKVHEYGIVHCDIKPANILLHRAPSGETRIKIIDFGVMRVLDDLRPRTFAGTPSYAAPEQLEERDVRPAADVFALGLLVFELATGTRAYEASGVGFQGARDRSTVAAPSLADAAPLGVTYPSSLVELVARMLELDPAKRPDAFSVTNALRTIANEVGAVDRSRGVTGPSLRGPTLTPAKRHPISIADVSATDIDVDHDALMRQVAAERANVSIASADTVEGEVIEARIVRALSPANAAEPPGVSANDAETAPAGKPRPIRRTAPMAVGPQAAPAANTHPAQAQTARTPTTRSTAVMASPSPAGAVPAAFRESGSLNERVSPPAMPTAPAVVPAAFRESGSLNERVSPPAMPMAPAVAPAAFRESGSLNERVSPPAMPMAPAAVPPAFRESGSLTKERVSPQGLRSAAGMHDLGATDPGGGRMFSSRDTGPMGPRPAAPMPAAAVAVGGNPTGGAQPDASMRAREETRGATSSMTQAAPVERHRFSERSRVGLALLAGAMGALVALGAYEVVSRRQANVATAVQASGARSSGASEAPPGHAMMGAMTSTSGVMEETGASDRRGGRAAVDGNGAGAEAVSSTLMLSASASAAASTSASPPPSSVGARAPTRAPTRAPGGGVTR